MLSVDSLSAGYGGRPVLDGVSFELGPGGTLALLGHNGAGKSTILKALCGLLRPSRGAISLDGEPTAGVSTEALVRRGVVMVPAGRRVFPLLSVRQNLMVGAFARSDRAGIAADCERMAERFPVLRAKANTPAGLLSGGEQQMLAIARGLMARPRLLLVDEPSLGLSPAMADAAFAALAGLAAEGVAFILAEQNVRRALAVTARALVLVQGRVADARPSAELLSDASFQQAYLGAA